jgi:hypothetical protein
VFRTEVLTRLGASRRAVAIEADDFVLEQLGRGLTDETRGAVLAELAQEAIELHRLLGLSVTGLRAITFGREMKSDSEFGPPVALYTPNEELLEKLQEKPSQDTETASAKAVMCFESDGCLCCYCIGMAIPHVAQDT